MTAVKLAQDAEQTFSDWICKTIVDCLSLTASSDQSLSAQFCEMLGKG